MVLADYNRRRRDENGAVASDSADISQIGGGAESRTSYADVFAEISEGTRIKEKRSALAALKFGTDRFQRSKTPRVIDDMVVTPMRYLTTKQRKRIVDTWKSIADRRQLGQRIYMQIFMHKPSLKTAAVKCKHLTRWIFLVTQSLFPFRNIPIDQLKDNPFFNRQSAIFADFLHTVVSFVQLDSENLLKDLCQRVGARHAQFTSVDFEPDWWRLFMNAVLDCLLPYFPPNRYSRSRRLSPSSLIAQLPFVGQWLRDSYKRAWSTLLEHAVQLMKEAFTNYRTREKQGGLEKSCDFQTSGDRCVARRSIGDERCLGTYNHGKDFEIGASSQDADDEDVELQLVIVTTPVEDYVEADAEENGRLSDGERSEEGVEGEDEDGGGDSSTSARDTTTAPTIQSSSFPMQQPVPPRSWETTRKQVLRLSSLEEWDLPD